METVNQEETEKESLTASEIIFESSPQPSNSPTPKLDLTQMSAATKKVIGKTVIDQTSPAKFYMSTRKVDSDDIPSTPQLATKSEPLSPDTPPLPNMNLTYFQLLQTKEPKSVPIELVNSPEMALTRDIISSSKSTPEPSTPDLTVNLTTTILMRSSSLPEQNGDYLPDYQATPEKSFHCDLENENDSENDLDDILNLSVNVFSPPKTSKILQPRKNHLGQGWIPLVSDHEWTHAPVFLQRQVVRYPYSSSPVKGFY